MEAAAADGDAVFDESDDDDDVSLSRGTAWALCRLHGPQGVSAVEGVVGRLVRRCGPLAG